MKRILSLVLILLLLTGAACADGLGLRFRLDVDMNPLAYPKDVQPLLSGPAELLNGTAVTGTFQMQDELFDLDTELTFFDSPRTKTQLRLHGDKKYWVVNSSLLGNETVYLFLDSLLEFAIKGYTYMDVPFQRAAILLTPYVHENGFSDLWTVIEPVLFRKEGDRTISRGALMNLADDLAQASQQRSFRCWAAAMGRETGYEDILLDTMVMLPEWFAGFLTSSGLTITSADGLETWEAGDHVLFELRDSLTDGLSMSLSLPPLPNGYLISGDAAFNRKSDTLYLCVNLHIVDASEATVLRIETSAVLPTTLPFNGSMNLLWNAEGPAVGGDGVHLRFEGEGSGDTVIIRQLSEDLQSTLLTITLSELSTFTPSLSEPVLTGTSLLSVTSDSLSALVKAIAHPMLTGTLPILAELPASTCQHLMNLLESSGIFDLLTGSVSSAGEEWDSFEDNADLLEKDDSDAPYEFFD